MEEKTLFTLRTARASTEESSENLDSKGHVVAYRFHSSRKKIVNGKVTEITTMNCSVDTGGASWIQQTDKTIGTEEIEISLGYSENTGSEARTATVTPKKNQVTKYSYMLPKRQALPIPTIWKYLYS